MEEGRSDVIDVMACRDIKPISQLREDIDVLILQS
jgi:hypothetical protein